MTEFTILTVCTGNICRSPLAEQLLRAGMAHWSEVSVASAGSGALVGKPMTDQAQALSSRFGATDAAAHIARALTVEHVRAADLILALSREHRRAIVELLPRASRKTFTLRELARLIADVPAEELEHAARLDSSDVAGRFAELVDVAASRRGLVAPPESPDDDDVIDPYRQPDGVYEASAQQLVPAVQTVLAQFARVAAVTLP
ncbi:low molecular weight phosphatase family protein [Diaminobutyricimonas sp. LJ205]|uniref:arsenate reductase/protein-tyrosine-phosphatase family protein n=1 Tax=Diaminobutyricimonas sp. LJ205 TaxID=2683590 RepID=UPI001E5FECA1|nr:low molecular weight phosphatase family protein [Diaminobutyricimonas sp. LJ205]